MKKVFVLLLVFGTAARMASAQEDDKNIVIKQAKEEYRFIKGNSTNPVKVKQESQVVYQCNAYRTSLPVVEFYNDQVEINEVAAKVDGDRVKNLAPVREYYSSEGIFYSDARVCYFTLPLEKKNSTSEVRFEKTILDPRYFTNVFFTESYPVQQKEVTIVVPKWMKIEIKEYNFKGYTINKSVANKGDEDVYTYTIENSPALKKESSAPGITYIAPHLLIMAKYAEPGGSRITYFNTLDDQYKWYRSLVKQIGNEPTTIKAKADELTKGLSGDMEKVKVLYQWVQDNIRYIAFEDGIAGFKPEKAQETLRKKYGDCKAMGNLMAELLKAVGLDGRLCWLGTNHIAYDYSTPSLGVDNHMICAWVYKGKTYFLDPTEKYIGFGELAERIQGRQILIENGDQYLLQTIPTQTPQQNTSYEKRVLRIQGNDLVGKVYQTWKGENKEWLLSHLLEMKKEKQDEALRKYLAEGNQNYQISNLKILNLDNYNADLKIEYDLLFKEAAVTFDKEVYLDVDNRKDYAQFNVDVAKRKLPYQFSYKNHTIFETEIQLPEGTKVGALPPPVNVEKPAYSMVGAWKSEGNKVTYRREIQLRKTALPQDQFTEWNEAVTKLNEFYNHQLTLTK